MDKGTLYFFTGLSGAGKTTIGGLFYRRMKERKNDVVWLDNDKVKAVFQDRNAGFTTEERIRRAYRFFRLAKMLTDQGLDVVGCTISMYEEVRRWNRENFEKYKEIYIKVPTETLRQRDQKGLYSSGAKDVVGIDLPWEEPKTPDVVIENDGSELPEQIIERLEMEFGL